MIMIQFTRRPFTLDDVRIRFSKIHEVHLRKLPMR